MRIAVNGVRLFVDIDGAALVPDGPVMREKPTLIALHGGPGADHSIYKPALSQLSDICQIVYVDHRGNGRSDDGDISTWNLAQWGDDIHGLCEVLGIEKPIIFGASFGGFVAQSYATRHPDRIGGLILACTAAHVDFERIYDAFARIGGPEAGAVARAYWSGPTPERRQAYFETCLPLYSVTPPDPDVLSRLILKNPVAMHFNGPQNEHGRMDYRTSLGTLTCPALILAGDRDPVMPREFSKQIAALMPHARYHVLENAGHLLEHDAHDAFFRHMRQFISEYSHAA
jgi:pimeloyl-ACP methyl ester carboxylesterase